MERRQQLDVDGFASTHRPMKATAILFTLAFFSFPLRAQTSLAAPKPPVEIKRLFAEERWQEIVRLAEIEAERSADLNYCYGIALFRLERWDEAKRAFQNGLRQQP